MAEILKLTGKDLEQENLQKLGTVLVDFWAPWCGPCQMLGPIIEEIAAQREDIIVAKINVDDEMELAKRFRIVSIPTVILMKNGEKIASSLGYKPKDDILKLL